MNILQIITSSYPYGAEHHVLDLSQLLKKRGHNVQVLCPEGWLTDQLTSLGVNIHLLDLEKTNFKKDRQFFHKLMNSYSFDIIHTHLSRATYMGMYAAWRYQLPMVSTMHLNTIEPAYLWAARLGHTVIAASEENRKLLAAKRVKSQRISMIPHGLDHWPTPGFDREAFLEKYPFLKNSFVILMAAAVKSVKGHALALEALHLLKRMHANVHLVCIGGEELDTITVLQTQVHQFNIAEKVSFMGFQPNVYEWMQAAHVLWVPSENESFSFSAAESLACGTPVIAGNVGALNEIIEHQQNGYIVPRDPIAFAQSTIDMIRNPELYQSMREYAEKNAIEQFSSDRMIQDLETLYEYKIGKKFGFRESNSSKTHISQ